MQDLPLRGGEPAAQTQETQGMEAGGNGQRAADRTSSWQGAACSRQKTGGSGQLAPGSNLVDWSNSREVKWAKRGNMGRDLLAFIVAASAPDTPASPLRHENR